MDEIKKYCKENQIYEFCDLIDAIVDGKKIDWLNILRKHYAVREIEQFLGWQRRAKRHKEAMKGAPCNRRIAKPVICLDNGLGSRSGNPRQLYCRDESDPRWRQLKEKIKSLKPKE